MYKPAKKAFFDFFSAFIFCVDCDIPIQKIVKRGVVDLRSCRYVFVHSSQHSKLVCYSCSLKYLH